MQVDFASRVTNALASMRIEWPQAQQFAGWSSIRTDLQCVQQAAQRLHHEISSDQPDPVLVEALTWMIVVRYGRCFTTCASRRVKLDEGDVRKQLDRARDLAALHSGLIERRNQTFAHAGEQCEHAVDVHLLNTPSGESLCFSPAFSSPGGIWAQEQCERIVQLTEAVTQVVQERLERVGKRLLERAGTEREALLAELRERRGTFSTPEAIAAALLMKLDI